MKKKPKIIAPRVANKAGYQVQDTWFHKAKAAGYRARSAFKLLQIQEMTGIIRPGMSVLDLGCAPGSWLQVIRKIVGEEGVILGIDLQPVDKFAQKNITTIVGDMTVPETHRVIQNFLQEFRERKQKTETENLPSGQAGTEELLGPKHEVWGIAENSLRDPQGMSLSNTKLKTQNFNVITSDVAPKTTGRNDDDQYHSAMLCLEVLKIAEKMLAPGGSLVMKIFVGRDLALVLNTAKKHFKKVQQIKPDACRDRSFEEYVVCSGFRG